MVSGKALPGTFPMTKKYRKRKQPGDSSSHKDQLEGDRSGEEEQAIMALLSFALPLDERGSSGVEIVV